jgi:hypothetical protein
MASALTSIVNPRDWEDLRRLRRMARTLGFIGDPRSFNEWHRTWQAREAALATLFGPPEPEVFHSPTPLNRGGEADVLAFRGYIPGITYVTADLTGEREDDLVAQLPNSTGCYELMLCTRAPVSWAAPALAQLGRYTLDNVVEAGHTMYVGPIAGSSLEHLAFAEPDLGGKPFAFLGRRYGLLLGIGITEAELRLAQAERTRGLVARLRQARVFPYTDPGRPSIA